MAHGSSEDPDPPGLLRELPRLSPAERESRLRGVRDAQALCLALIQELEKLVITDLTAALECGRALVEIVETAGSAIAAVRARRCFAQALAYSNRYEESIGELNRAIERAELAGEPVEAGRARLTTIHPLARLGRLEEAIAAGEAAQRVFREACERAFLAKTNANLGVVHRMRDDPAAALRCLDEAAALLAEEPAALAQVQSNRAEALLDLHRFTEAEEAFKAALGGFEHLGAARAAAIVLGNLADLAARQGRLEEALRWFEKAAAIFEDAAAPGDLGRLRAEHAEALSAIGAFSEAATLFDQALPALESAGLVFEHARALIGKARALVQAGRAGEAERLLDKAVEQFESLTHHTGTGRAMLMQGEIAMQSRNLASAKNRFAGALERLLDRPIDAAHARISLAAIAIETENLLAADALIAAAHADLERLNHAPGLAHVLQTRAQLRQRQGMMDAALDDLRRAVEQIERIRGLFQPGRLRSAFVGARLDAYESLVRLLLDQGDVSAAAERPLVEEALLVSEHAKSRSLLDALAGAFASVEVAADSFTGPHVDEIARLVRELNALYAAMGDFSEARDRKPDVSDQTSSTSDRRPLTSEIEDREKRLALLESRAAASGAGVHGLGGLFASPLTAEQIARLLPERTALLEYFVAGDEVLAFVVANESVHVVRHLADRLHLAERVERFSFHLQRSLARLAAGSVSDRARPDLEREMQELHQVLVEPTLEFTAGAKRLLIVPHGRLHALPLHALVPAPLIASREVAFLPSASVLAYLERHGTEAQRHGGAHDGDGGASLHGSAPSCATASSRSLVVGISDESLPNVPEEVQTIAAALGDAETLCGEDATAEALTTAVSGKRLVHLACHGRFSAMLPMASGLRLADRWLTIRELYGLRLNGAAVTLSACETGRAAVAAGDELVGLTRALLGAGASSVLIALWPSHDETSAKIMARTYELWQNGGDGLAASLAQVQREQHDAGLHPALWAPLVPTGVHWKYVAKT